MCILLFIYSYEVYDIINDDHVLSLKSPPLAVQGPASESPCILAAIRYVLLVRAVVIGQQGSHGVARGMLGSVY